MRGFGDSGVEMKFWGYIILLYYILKYRMTGYAKVALEPDRPW